jgi:uncharacterized damage-inducible protein DinB
MESQPTISELLNVIELQKKALEFYAESKNYEQNIHINNELSSIIEIDNGHQARFTLEQSKKIKEYNQTLIEEYNKSINEIKQQMDEPILSLTDFVDQDQLNKLNNIMKKYGNKN